MELFSDQDGVPLSWSEDEKTLVLISAEGIGILPLENGQETKLLMEDGTLAILSPDGKWLSYLSQSVSDKSSIGTMWEIYVCPFPDVKGGKWKVSNDGGSQKWSPDGRELIYWTDDALMVAGLETEPNFICKTPKVLLRRKPVISRSMGSDGISWDIHPNNGKFLMIKPFASMDDTSAEESTAVNPRKIVIVLNSFEELKKLVPTD